MLEEPFAELSLGLLEEQVIDELSNPLWNLGFVGAYKAREEFGVNGEDVTVAVIDSGIDDKNPELEGKVVDAFNIEKEDRTDLEDKSGHGTYVAGIIAGNRTGVAPAVKLVSIKLRYDQANYQRDLTRSLEFCEILKPDIINISSGSPWYSDGLEYRCNKVINGGIVIVAAAGNYSTGAFFPASYDSAISVVAVKSDTEHYTFSNIWPTADISAPGFKILSTHPLDENGTPRYSRKSGTSAATPHISGVLALGASLLKKKQGEGYIPNPSLLITTLKETAIDVSEEEPYRADAFELLKKYQRYYDKKRVFLKDSPEVIKAVYGGGHIRAYEFLKRLDKKT